MAASISPWAENVTGVVIPEAGHFIPDEQPDATVDALTAFIDHARVGWGVSGSSPTPDPQRLAELTALAAPAVVARRGENVADSQVLGLNVVKAQESLAAVAGGRVQNFDLRGKIRQLFATAWSTTGCPSTSAPPCWATGTSRRPAATSPKARVLHQAGANSLVA